MRLNKVIDVIADEIKKHYYIKGCNIKWSSAKDFYVYVDIDEDQYLVGLLVSGKTFEDIAFELEMYYFVKIMILKVQTEIDYYKQLALGC